MNRPVIVTLAAVTASLTSVALAAPVPASVEPAPVAASSAVATEPDVPADLGSGARLVDGDVVPLQVTGPPRQRLNLIVLGDGYTADQAADFRADVDKHLNILWSLEPFRDYRDYFNVYLIEVASNESGVSCDPDHGNVRRDTALNLQYAGECPADPNARGVTFGPGGQEALEDYVSVIDGVTPQNRQTLTIANTDTYGGIGGRNATTTADNALSPYITPHELGHSLGELQDEYPYYERGVPGDPYTGPEPESVHHTVLTEEQMLDQHAKWWRWIGEESLSGGYISRYESGQYACCDIWRPSKHSMMRWLAYPYDQVGREKMVERISGRRDLQQLSIRATPGDEVGRGQVLWVQTPHPTYHSLDLTWTVNGKAVRASRDRPYLDLAAAGVRRGDVVRLHVADPTPWVRDPAVFGGPTMTADRSWVVGEPADSEPVRAAIIRSTSTTSPLGAEDVAYVVTTQPTDRVLDVTWRLDGRLVPGTGNARSLDLGGLDLRPGTHQLRAVLSDPDSPGVADTRTWTVDAVAPSVSVDLSAPHSRRNGVPVYRNWFTMGLTPTDDQEGYVVAEFRLDGDGWHQYYGWTDSPAGTPFLFTPRGTEIKALIYGALSPGGMSWAPFEDRDPGYGRHTVEVRAIDAAGNVSRPDRFRVLVEPGQGDPPPTRLRHPG